MVNTFNGQFEGTWQIPPRVDVTGMMMNDEENKGFASFALAFISTSYNSPKKEISVTTEWVKSLKVNPYTFIVKF